MSLAPNPPRALRILPVTPRGASIPKTIHQVYFSKDLPPEIDANVEKIKRLNPGWEYKLYDDDDMETYVDSAYGPRVRAYYDRINKRYGASRADLFRYLLIYREGGVYLDIKSSMERPLDDVLEADDVFILSRWRNAPGERYAGWGVHGALKALGGQELQQWHVIAAAGQPLMRDLIGDVLENIDGYNPLLQSTGKGGVIRVTGPIAYTRSIVPRLAHEAHRMVDSQIDLGLVYSIYDAHGITAHKAIFKTHYTDLREPVVYLSGARKLLWLSLAPVQNWVRRVRNALQR